MFWRFATTFTPASASPIWPASSGCVRGPLRVKRPGEVRTPAGPPSRVRVPVQPLFRLPVLFRLACTPDAVAAPLRDTLPPA